MSDELGKLQELLEKLKSEEANKQEETEEENLQYEEKEYIDNFENYRRDIVAIVGFLIGIPESALHNEKKFNQERIEELENNKDAQIIRALSILRTQFMINYTNINNAKGQLVSLENMPNDLSAELIRFLRKEEIEVAGVNYKGVNNVMVNVAYINQALLENIDKVKRFIPAWINYDYIKNLFLMPNCYAGNKGCNIAQKGSKIVVSIHELRGFFVKNKNNYPYQMYLNFPCTLKEEFGNILFNDAKFLKLLYAYNHDIFKAVEYVVDAKIDTKENIYKFINEAYKAAIFVDCENVDPYYFAAMMLNLDKSSLATIKKVVLIDDEHTADAWDYIESIINVPVEHKEINRVLENKSLVDQYLTMHIMESFYQDSVESIMLASSDSDFWGVISFMKDKMKFFVLNERRITSYQMIETLDNAGVNHCYMDDFALDKIQDLKRTVLYDLLNKKIDKFNEEGIFVDLDFNQLVDNLFFEARIMGAPEQIEQEKQNFINTYLKKGFVVRPTEMEDGTIKLVMSLASKY